MIFDQEPRDWRELEEFVQQLFSEIGCNAERGKTIATVRGEVDIDVYVQDPIVNPRIIYLCECKNWSNPVPKTVVHAFRTVVNDYGAHRGFLISQSGFQSGAYEAAQSSNIKLVTWEQFQSLFFDRWVYSMGAKLADVVEPILPYIEPHNLKGLHMNWDEELHARREDLEYRYDLFHEASRYLSERLAYRKRFPLEVHDPRSNATERGTITLNTYREYYDLAFALADQALQEFQTFYEESD